LFKITRRDGEKEVRCDYVRFWSAAKSSAEFHHQALHMVVKYLRSENKVANLKRIRLWTDGDRGTYKGFQNFGRMAFWPLDPKTDGYVGLIISHFFSGHSDH
jgi:hypothetical protein